MKSYRASVLSVWMGLAACSGSTPPAQTAPAATASQGAEVTPNVSTLTNDPNPSAETALSREAARVEPVAIVAGTRREVPTPTPTVRITAPRNGVTLRENRVELRLDVRNWRNPDDASDQRHVHVVVDNNEYIRVDDPRRPVALTDLAEGTHVVRVFPGWETHESVKTDGAFAMLVFHVGRPTPNFSFDPRAPMLVYSRPKGTMTGAAADRVLLDWYLVNVPAGDLGAEGVRVRPSIDGQSLPAMTAWQPHYIEHLPAGEHTVVLELLGRDGNVIPGPFNRAERRIVIERPAH